jgi:hypothetical protein
MAGLGALGSVAEATKPKLDTYDEDEQAASTYKGPYVPGKREVSFQSDEDMRASGGAEGTFFTPSNPQPRLLSDLTPEERAEYGYAEGGIAALPASDDFKAAMNYFGASSPGAITASMRPTTPKPVDTGEIINKFDRKPSAPAVTGGGYGGYDLSGLTNLDIDGLLGEYGYTKNTPTPVKDVAPVIDNPAVSSPGYIPDFTPPPIMDFGAPGRGSFEPGFRPEMLNIQPQEDNYLQQDFQYNPPAMEELQYNPPAMQDFQYTPPAMQDFQYTPPSMEEIQYTPPAMQDFQYTPPSMQDIQYTPPSMEEIQYNPPAMQDFQYTPPSMQDFQYTPPSMEDIQYTPPSMQEIQYTPPSMEDFQQYTMPVEDSFRGYEPMRDYNRFNQFDNLEEFAVGGRVNMKNGSFVVDARTVSELGNGSSNAGMEFLSRMGGRPLQGPGDGVSDSIRARIGGKQEARVARDEVLFSPEAVKRLGKGSSKRGTAKLYALMDRAHKARKKAKRGQDTKVRKGLA